MEFRIADTFTDGLARLRGDEQKAVEKTPEAEIDKDASAALNSDAPRPFDKPKSGRIAVKVINHLGDEVMKVFRVE